MSRQDCIEMIEERRNPQHEPSWIDMFCLYFAYGLAKNDAINTATLAMEEADLDRNGVIDHNGMFPFNYSVSSIKMVCFLLNYSVSSITMVCFLLTTRCHR